MARARQAARVTCDTTPLAGLIDMAHAHAMGEAARELMDEAEFVGLRGDVRMDAKENVRVVGERTLHNYRINI